MSQRAVLAIWHDTTPEAATEIQNWYNREHHPERLSVPGFRRARRHRAVQGGPSIFIVYDVDSTEVLRSEAYLARLNSPTDWTRRCMPHFRGNIRSVCHVSEHLGHGVGGSVATLRITPHESKKEALAERVREEMANFMMKPGSVSAEYWLADTETSTLQSNERALRGASDIVTPSVLFLSASDSTLIKMVAAQLNGPNGLAAHGAADTEISLYELQMTMDSIAEHFSHDAS